MTMMMMLGVRGRCCGGERRNAASLLVIAAALALALTLTALPGQHCRANALDESDAAPASQEAATTEAVAATAENDVDAGVVDEVKREVRIAVVGSGFGAGTAVHYLAEYAALNPAINLTTHVFEASSYVGGRARTIKFEGEKFEAGGSVIHGRNQYVRNLTALVGLELTSPSYKESAGLGVFDGESVVFKTASMKLLTMFRMLMRYWTAPIYMSSVVSDLLEKFDHIYEEQEKGTIFKSAGHMLQLAGLGELTETTLKAFLAEKGVSGSLHDEIVTGVMRINYNQDTGLNAFAGAVSLAGASADLYAIKGGNCQLPAKLFSLHNAKVRKNTRVLQISKTPEGVYELISARTTSSAKKRRKEVFDAVVVAAPLENADIKFTSKNHTQYVKNSLREFREVHVTFVRGELNTTYFGYAHKLTLPTVILTNNDALPFSSIGMVKTSAERNAGVFKVFSKTKLEDAVILDMFVEGVNTSAVQRYAWDAYPVFSPPETFSPFKIDTGLVYNNAVENSASALEMVAIAGRNSALAIAKDIFDVDVAERRRLEAEEESEKMGRRKANRSEDAGSAKDDGATDADNSGEGSAENEEGEAHQRRDYEDDEDEDDMHGVEYVYDDEEEEENQGVGEGEGEGEGENEGLVEDETAEEGLVDEEQDSSSADVEYEASDAESVEGNAEADADVDSEVDANADADPEQEAEADDADAEELRENLMEDAAQESNGSDDGEDDDNITDEAADNDDDNDDSASYNDEVYNDDDDEALSHGKAKYTQEANDDYDGDEE